MLSRPLSHVLAAVTLALLLMGCESNSERTSDRQTNTASASPVTCAEPDRLGVGDIRGRATGATLWALPFKPLPLIAGQEVKIAWRMTGSGPPQFTVTSPSGEDADVLQWGPEAHSDSTWNRPGDEWGTGFHFTHAGCWRITVRRDNATGSISVKVVDP